MTRDQMLQQVRHTYDELGSDFPRFEREMRRLIKKGRETGDFFLIGIANHYLAMSSYVSGGERDTVLFYAIKATAMLDKTDHAEAILLAYNMLGVAYLAQEDFQSALIAYNKAYQMVRKRRKLAAKRDILLNNIADCYFQMGDYKSSIKIFAPLLEDIRKREPTQVHLRDNAIYSINLAACYERSKDYATAKAILDPACEWIDSLEDKMWICIFYARRTCILYNLGRKDEGSLCADKVLAFIADNPDMYEYHVDFEEIAHALIRNGDFDRSLRFAQVLTDYAEKSGHTIDRLLACRVMADYYSKTGALETALSCYEELNRLYAARSEEERAMQLAIHKKTREADREIRKLNKKVKLTEESASRDPLTRLLNRSALLQVATEFIGAARQRKEKVGVIFLDIDFFKECNDTYGHSRGDEIIREVANACLKEETPQIRFARYGGDEFFGITHGLSDEEVAEVARKICQRIRSADIPNRKSPHGQRLTLSCGVINVTLTDRDSTIIDIANYADKALYHAKGAGRNAIYRFDCERADEHGDHNTYIKIAF